MDVENHETDETPSKNIFVWFVYFVVNKLHLDGRKQRI
jgi:hypothetical protein